MPPSIPGRRSTLNSVEKVPTLSGRMEGSAPTAARAAPAGSGIAQRINTLCQPISSPEVLPSGRGHHRGDRHRGKDDRQRLWHMGRRHQTHRRGGGHRPEAADGDPQQQTAQQEKNASESATRTIRLRTICSMEKNISTQRRSILRVAVAISRPVTNATSAVAVTALSGHPFTDAEAAGHRR